MSTSTTTSPKKRAPRKTTAKKRTQRASAASTTRTSEDESRSYAVAQNTLSLVALSPFRFPLDVERIAVNTARLSAAAFVFLGLLFTYFYIESEVTTIALETAQTAAIATAIQPSLTPEVSFTYAKEGMHGTRIAVTVPAAESVELYAYSTNAKEYEKLGAAFATASNTWEFIWDTIDVAPGIYWIKALVTNEHGIYDRSDSAYVVID